MTKLIAKITIEPLKLTEFERHETLIVDYYTHDGEWIGNYSETLRLPIRYHDVQQGIIDIAAQRGAENHGATAIHILGIDTKG